MVDCSWSNIRYCRRTEKEVMEVILHDQVGWKYSEVPHISIDTCLTKLQKLIKHIKLKWDKAITTEFCLCAGHEARNTRGAA
jgi:hypothetical protein